MAGVPVPDALAVVRWIGLLLSLSLAGLAFAIVARAVRVERTNRRKAAVRPALRAALFDRLGREEPNWESWVSDLSTVERTVLGELLDSHLRLVDGSDREHLQPLAAALGVDRWALRTLETSDRYETLRALGWLALLDHPHDPTLLRRACAGDDALRAAGARVMLERAYADAPAAGMALLLCDPTTTLSTFGLDTLYELTRSQPDALVEYARTHHEHWTPALLVQVLRVLRTAAPLGVEHLGWVVEQCAHGSAGVRAAAVRTLADSGWRRELRSRMPVAALVDDPSPDVRTATYRTLGAWKDAEAHRALARAARREQNARCRLTAVEILHRHRYHDRTHTGIRHEFPRLWRWATATQHAGNRR